MRSELKNESTAKSLKSQLKIREGELEALKVKIANLQREQSQKSAIIKSLREQVLALGNTSEFEVTDHAIIRYFERVLGIDIEAAKDNILTPKIKEAATLLGGTGSFPSEDGFTVRMKNYTIITVIINQKS